MLRLLSAPLFWAAVAPAGFTCLGLPRVLSPADPGAALALAWVFGPFVGLVLHLRRPPAPRRPPRGRLVPPPPGVPAARSTPPPPPSPEPEATPPPPPPAAATPKGRAVSLAEVADLAARAAAGRAGLDLTSPEINALAGAVLGDLHKALEPLPPQETVR